MLKARKACAARVCEVKPDSTKQGMGAALWAVVLVGAALRLWQYAADASLWVDEVALAKGVLSLDLWGLLSGPLPYNQVAPKGFLLAEKLAALALGPSGYALRLFPLVCSLAALAAFARLARRVLEGVGPLAAVTLFATAAPLITFGSLVKQYSTEVCVAVILWLLAYDLMLRPRTPRRAAAAALLGALLVWFSNAGVLMLAALGASLAAWAAFGSAQAVPRRTLAPVLACWGASALGVTAVALAHMSPETRAYMQRFWAVGFAPRTLSGLLDTRWPLDRLEGLFGPGQVYDGLAYPAPMLYVAMSAVGFVLLWRRNRRAAVLLLAPLLLTLAAAVFRQYPFTDRLIAFLIPSLILAIAAAAEGARRLLRPRSRALGALSAAALVLPAVYHVAATPPPYYTEDIKSVLSYVRERRRPGDVVYVYYGSAPAVEFYAPRYGLARGAYLNGGCHRGDPRRYLRELDAFRGQPRVWVLLTHAHPRLLERENILAYLDAVGTRRDTLVVESRAFGHNLRPAEAHLYDLSDAGRLATASADSFPVKEPPTAVGPSGCGVGSQATVESDFR